jgi:hypothetical protein
VKSRPAGHDVTIVVGSPYARAVAASHTPQLKHPDLVLRLHTALDGLKPSFQYVHGHRGHSEHEVVEKLATRAAQGTIHTPSRRPWLQHTGRLAPHLDAVSGRETTPRAAMKSRLFGRIQGTRREANTLSRHVGPWLAPMIPRHERPAHRACSMPRHRHPWRDPAAFPATACLTHQAPLDVRRG